MKPQYLRIMLLSWILDFWISNCTYIFMLMCNTSGCHSTSRLSIFDWNCNGLLAHRAELLHHIEITRNMYHVLCLQETFLKPGKHFSVAGYNVIRKDRTGGRKARLVMFPTTGLFLLHAWLAK